MAIRSPLATRSDTSTGRPEPGPPATRRRKLCQELSLGTQVCQAKPNVPDRQSGGGDRWHAVTGPYPWTSPPVDPITRATLQSPERPMKLACYDVYLSTTQPDGPVAAAVAGGLSRLGFRVCVAGRSPGTAGVDERLAIIADTADFVVVQEGAASEPDPDGPSTRDQEIAQALATGRNLLWIAEHTAATTTPAPPSPRLITLKPWQYVPFDPARSREAVAILSHRLLSSQEVEDRLLMRRVKQATAVAAAALLVVVAGLIIPPLLRTWNQPKPPPPVPPFEIHWAGFGQRTDAGRTVPFRVRAGVPVGPGDQIRLLLAPSADGFAYVITTDRRGAVRVLFPDTTLRGVAGVKAGRTYEVPGGDRWLTVDPEAGLAGVFIIASYDSLENLEELAEEPDGEGQPKARLELLASTLDGLLDGRHAAVRSRPMTRKGQVVLQHLGGSAAPAPASVSVADGSRVTYPYDTQRGLVAAAVEIRFPAAEPVGADAPNQPKPAVDTAGHK